MGKSYFSIVMFVVVSLIISSCSENINYKEACEKQNFQKAYKIVDILKEEADKRKEEYAGYTGGWFDFESSNEKEACQKWENAKKKAEEAEKYVILQEAMFVLESEGTKGITRIVGIAKEHNAEAWLYSELTDVAGKIGDTDLEESINNIVNNSENGLKLKTTSVDGIAYDYFEIVNQNKYTLQEDDMMGSKLCVRIKYTNNIPKKIINEWKKEAKKHMLDNPGISFGCNLFDNNGSCISSIDDSDGIDLKDIENMSIGDTHTIWIYVYEKNDIKKARGFSITTRLVI